MVDNLDRLNRFLTDYFTGLKLQEPLFYAWTVALRLETKEVFGSYEKIKREKLTQALAWFDALFSSGQEIILVNDYQKKVGLLPVLQKEAPNTQSIILSQTADYNGQILTMARDIAVCQAGSVGVDRIMSAIINKSYGGAPIGSVFFLNLPQKAIFNLFSEVGADVVASEATTLRPLYHEFTRFVPEKDRGRIRHGLNV